MSDTLFVRGRYYVSGEGSREGSVLVREGRILAVGEHDQVASLARSNPTVVDVEGQLVSPSFGDSHLHPVVAGLELGQCSLDHCADAAECAAAIASYAAEHPDLPWILGGGWWLEWFERGTPSRELLDSLVPDRPVLLRNRDHHGAWANSRALAVAGIDAGTPDPADGRIERTADGEPQGTLHEGAVQLVLRVAPEPALEDLLSGLVRGQEHMLSLGVTHWQDALLGMMGPSLDSMDAYLEAERRGQLVVKATGALWWARDEGLDQIDALQHRRDRAQQAGGRFRASAVKLMVDGVAENYTAHLSRPYRDGCGHETHNFGISFIDAATLRDAVALLDRNGFQAHLHSLGDQAVTDALDAVAHARTTNGGVGPSHTLAHLQIVRPQDVPRFAPLNAIANIQPLWARLDPQMTELTLPFIDEQLARWHYPFASLLRSGAALAAGSDWPISNGNPLWGMHVAVTRTTPRSGEDSEPFIPEQALPLTAIWDAYTLGVARQNDRDGSLGRLAPGYDADLVVLDRDPFLGPPHEIGDTEVVSTWVDGNQVYRRDS